ncbi:hypothetical protein WAF17_01940 [Bernardetia sp. ABR2-2B]|uniref:hypothetical protein n=1 Tax=Bernardetia sp. ABR2-2B TaxID=3127472 RepID=UPI0030D1A058
MKNIFLLLSFLFINYQLLAQSGFDKGYIIDKDGNKKECLIKNLYRFDNPETIEYKLIGSSKLETGSISDIKEFGVTDTIKYIRAIVNIDKTEDGLNSSIKTNIHLTTDTLFLNQLIEGKANLYKYSFGSLNRFFFNIEDDTIKQLIYKRYLENGKEKKNLTYIQQLITKVNCQKFRYDRFQNIKYNTKSLITFFEDYNTCENEEYINFDSKIERRQLIRMYGRVGINVSQNSLKRNYTDFAQGGGVGIKLGYELEVVVPIMKKDIFSVFGEVSYYQFNTKVESNTPVPSSNALGSTYNNYIFTHKNLEGAIGLRTYLPLNQNNAFFIDASLAGNGEIQSELVTDRYSMIFSFKHTNIFGVGYRNRRVVIQAKYYDKEVEGSKSTYQNASNYQNISGFVFTIGYQFF